MGISHKWADCVGLRYMDFLNIPGRLWIRTRPPSTSRPGLVRALRDIRVPQSLFGERNIKKISCAFARHNRPIYAICQVQLMGRGFCRK